MEKLLKIIQTKSIVHWRENGYDEIADFLLQYHQYSNSRLIRLTYFKESTGKYYSCGEFFSNSLFYDVVTEVRRFKKEGILPGLVEGTREFDVLIECDGVQHIVK